MDQAQCSYAMANAQENVGQAATSMESTGESSSRKRNWDEMSVEETSEVLEMELRFLKQTGEFKSRQLEAQNLEDLLENRTTFVAKCEDFLQNFTAEPVGLMLKKKIKRAVARVMSFEMDMAHANLECMVLYKKRAEMAMVRGRIHPNNLLESMQLRPDENQVEVLIVLSEAKKDFAGIMQALLQEDMALDKSLQEVFNQNALDEAKFREYFEKKKERIEILKIMVEAKKMEMVECKQRLENDIATIDDGHQEPNGANAPNAVQKQQEKLFGNFVLNDATKAILLEEGKAFTKYLKDMSRTESINGAPQRKTLEPEQFLALAKRLKVLVERRLKWDLEVAEFNKELDKLALDGNQGVQEGSAQLMAAPVPPGTMMDNQQMNSVGGFDNNAGGSAQ